MPEYETSKFFPASVPVRINCPYSFKDAVTFAPDELILSMTSPIFFNPSSETAVPPIFKVPPPIMAVSSVSPSIPPVITAPFAPVCPLEPADVDEEAAPITRVKSPEMSLKLIVWLPALTLRSTNLP